MDHGRGRRRSRRSGHIGMAARDIHAIANGRELARVREAAHGGRTGHGDRVRREMVHPCWRRVWQHKRVTIIGLHAVTVWPREIPIVYHDRKRVVHISSITRPYQQGQAPGETKCGGRGGSQRSFNRGYPTRDAYEQPETVTSVMLVIGTRSRIGVLPRGHRDRFCAQERKENVKVKPCGRCEWGRSFAGC
jgi:hypothetical protein